MKCIDKLAWLLLIIAGLNWGMIGLANTNVIDMIFGMGSVFTMCVNVLFGVSAIYAIFRWCSCCSSCKK